MSPAQWFELALLAAIGAWLFRRKPQRQDSRRRPPRPASPTGRKWGTRQFWRWMAWWWAVPMALLLLAVPAAADGPERAYTTANPATSEWLGLATQQGRYAIVLGTDPGCDAIGPDMNVLATTDMSSPTWMLQIDGSDQVCTVTEWHWMGDTPCFTNADGECDVADA